jgi:hypothetical protein
MYTRTTAVVIGTLSLVLAGCDSDTPGAASRGPTTLNGPYLMRLELSPSCLAIPTRSFQWGGEAFRGEEGTVFRVPSLYSPNDPTTDHIRLVLNAGIGSEVRGELRLNGAATELPDALMSFGSVLTDGLAGVTGTVANAGGGRGELLGATLVGTVVVQWEKLGSSYQGRCAYADHQVSLLPF